MKLYFNRFLLITLLAIVGKACYSNQAFFDAVENGHTEKVKELTKDIDIDAFNEVGITAMHIAARDGNLDMLKYLIKMGANPQIETSVKAESAGFFHNTPISLAIENGHRNIVQYLIEQAEVNPNAQKYYDETILHVAIRTLEEYNCVKKDEQHKQIIRNIRNIIEYIIKAQKIEARKIKRYSNSTSSAEYNINHAGESPLHAAAIIGDLETFKLIVDQDKYDLNRPNKEGMTPLHYATQEGHLEIVQYLIEEKSIDPNLKVIKGEYEHSRVNFSPIHIAAQNGELEIIKYLVEKCGVDINLQHIDIENSINNIGSPLYIASQNLNSYADSCDTECGCCPCSCEEDSCCEETGPCCYINLVLYFIKNKNVDRQDILHALSVMEFDLEFFEDHELLEEILKTGLELSKITDKNRQTLVKALINSPEAIIPMLQRLYHKKGLIERLLKDELLEKDQEDPIVWFLRTTLKTAKALASMKKIAELYPQTVNTKELEKTVDFLNNFTNSCITLKILGYSKTKEDGDCLSQDCAQHIMGFINSSEEETEGEKNLEDEYEIEN